MSHPIPTAALDDRLAFVGNAGSGKTYAAGTAVERLLSSGARVVIPDPLGVWWGLALAKDGKTPSIFRKQEKLVIFGGPRGDLGLTEHSGALIGETVAGMAESCILDLSELKTGAAERRFMLAFLAALYKHKTREPLHTIFDEADMWAPQRVLDREGEAMKLLGMMETICRRGRVKGFIPWLISQRPAVISKNVLSQIDGMIALKLTSVHDRDAIGDWVEGQADKAQWKAMFGQLATMERGQGVVWVPGRGILKTAKFPEKVTFDSSRAPKRGERVTRAKTLKPVNLGKLKERLATVEAESKANDPKALQGKVAELTATIWKLEKTSATAKPVKPGKDAIAAAEKRGVQTTLASAERTIRSLRVALEAAMKFIVEINAKDFFKAGGEAIDKKAIEKAITDATGHITKMIEVHLGRRDKQIEALRAEAGRVINRLKGIIDQDVTIKLNVQHNKPFTIATSGGVRTPAAIVLQPAGDGTYNGPQMKVLRSLAMWRALGHEEPTREMVAAVAGYAPSSGGFNNILGGLSTMGAIGKPRPGCVSLLADGVEVIGKEEGRDILISKLSHPQRKIVAVLIDDSMKSREFVAEQSGYAPSSGGYNNLLGSLSTLGIIVKPQPGHVELSAWAQELLTGFRESIAA